MACAGSGFPSTRSGMGCAVASTRPAGRWWRTGCRKRAQGLWPWDLSLVQPRAADSLVEPEPENGA